jgi:hydroxyacylglutathione hydrolase
MMAQMQVIPVPCLSDNYAYLVTADGSRDTVVIDPSETAPVAERIAREGLRLVAIVNTHHHFDHVGGNEGLLQQFGAMPVYAHVSDVGRVPAQTERVEEGQPFELVGLTWRPLHVPGHTTGAVSYCVDGSVFTGDTLFVAGCGRLFEGTPAMMHASLSKLAALPGETRVYCGHEYTVSNLRFAQSVEPDSEAIAEKLASAQNKRQKSDATVPSTIADELATNPFFRCNEPSVQARYPGATPIEVFAAVRRAKDTFR